MPEQSRLNRTELEVLAVLNDAEEPITGAAIYRRVDFRFNTSAATNTYSVAVSRLAEDGYVAEAEYDGRGNGHVITRNGSRVFAGYAEAIAGGRIDVDAMPDEEAQRLYADLADRLRGEDRDLDPIRDCEDCGTVQVLICDFRTGEPVWVCADPGCDRRDEPEHGASAMELFGGQELGGKL